jgi:hypothetical protein
MIGGPPECLKTISGKCDQRIKAKRKNDGGESNEETRYQVSDGLND